MWKAFQTARVIVFALGVCAAAPPLAVVAAAATRPDMAGSGRSAGAQPSTAAECGAAPYDCAVAQVQRREFAIAVRTLEQVLAQAPRDLRALNLLGIALTGAGKPDAANARFREALAIDPRFTPARKNLAINEFNLGRFADAQRHLDDVLKQRPDDEIAHLHVGEIQFQRTQLRAALPHYEKARARIPQNPRWIVHYATCLLDAGRRDDAVRALEPLLAATTTTTTPSGADAAPTRATSGADAAASSAATSESQFEAGVALGQFGAHAEAARFFGAARTAGYKDAYAAGYNQALMLIEAADYDAAIRVVQELLAAPDGKRAELYNLVSRAYAKTNRIKDAYDALREATRLEPAAAEHYIDLAMLCLEHENYDLGLEIVDVGLKHRPDSSMLYLQRGVVLAMKGSVEQAEQEFDRASKANPDDPSPWVALAMVWVQTGRASKAVDVLRARTQTPTPPSTRTRAQTSTATTTATTTTAARPPHPVLFYALGIALVRSGAAPDDAAGTEAMEAFRTAVRLNPEFGPAQAELGKLLLKRSDVPGAIAHLERAIALEPDNAAPAYVLAQAYRRAGQTDRARDLLARVSKLNAQERGDDPDTDLKRVIVRIVREGATTTPTTTTPTRAGDATARGATAGGGERPTSASAASVSGDVEARFARGTACVSAGDVDGAIAQLRQVIDAAPSFAEARYNLGLALYQRFKHPITAPRKDDLDDAVAQVTKAVEREPSQPRFQLLLGELLAEQQNLGPAIEHLTRAFALAPTDPEYAFNLGLALRLHGDLDQAETQFRTALSRNADHAMARRSLGLVLRQKGDYAAAATELRRAVALVPDDAQGHHLLATALTKLDDLPGAIAELRQATRLDPSLIEARVLLAQSLAKSGQHDEARKEQAEVQRLNAEKADFGRLLVLLDSSAALLQKGDVAAAIAQRREAIALSPTFAEAHYQLGLALLRADGTGTRDTVPGDTKTSADASRVTTGGTATSAASTSGGASTSRNVPTAPVANRLAEAAAAFRQAIALDAKHARAFAELARVLDARGDTTGAEQARQHAAALAPCGYAVR